MKIPLIHKCRAPTKRWVYEVSFKINDVPGVYINRQKKDIYIYIYMVQQIDYTPGSTPSIFEWRYATVNPIPEHVHVHFVIFILD